MGGNVSSPQAEAAEPVQFSATSHTPPALRQVTVLAWKLSAGQAAVLPVQLSATSHTPAAPRHSVPEGSKLSAGQAAPAPVQFSAVSQMPALPRHSTVLSANASVGHSAPLPSQVSSTSQGPSTWRQVTLSLCLTKPSAGQWPELPFTLVDKAGHVQRAGRAALAETRTGLTELNARLTEGFTDAEIDVVARWLTSLQTKFPTGDEQ